MKEWGREEGQGGGEGREAERRGEEGRGGGEGERGGRWQGQGEGCLCNVFLSKMGVGSSI